MAVEDRYRRMPFGEAIEFLRQKIAIPTDRWDDISESEHDAAFVVAGAKGSLLTDLQRAVTRAIADGQGVEQFTETFKQISQNWVHRGDKDWRARIIFQTNMRMAYAAGRYQYQLDPDVLRLQPYLQYLHGGSQDPRPSHIALHERVFRARELPFYPPNGFGCSCRTVSLDEDKLAARGLEVSEIRRGDLVPYELPDGQQGQARVQPDKGFDYVPGQTRADERQRMIEAVIARLEPEQARWVREEVAQINQRIRERRLDPSRVDSVMRQAETLNRVETEIRNKVDRERAYVVDADGTVVLSKDGEALSVDFTYEELQLIRGKVFTHNHPKGGSFSREDIDFLLTNYPSEMRAVSQTYRYSIKLPDNPIDAFFNMRNMFDRARESVRLELLGRFQSGELTQAEAGQEFMHLIWTRISNELGLDYKRERWSDAQD